MASKVSPGCGAAACAPHFTSRIAQTPRTSMNAFHLKFHAAPTEITLLLAPSRLQMSIPTRGDFHEYDSNVRICRCRADHGLCLSRDRLTCAAPATGSDGRHATNVRSQRGSRFGVAVIGTRARTPSGRAPDDFAPWIRPSWRVRRPRPGGALFWPLGVLAVRTGRGGASVPICQRSSGAARRSRRVTVFARRDRPARPLASRRERLSSADQ
jgi:hypothetical protein